jgi:hypothetical protein
MATPLEYKAVIDRLTSTIQGDLNQFVPAWAMGMIPANEAAVLASQLGKLAVDTLDAYRAQEKPS